MAEDSPEDRAILGRMLARATRARLTLTEVDTVAGALAACGERGAAPFDAVFLDYFLPDGTALDVLAGLCRSPGEPSCPVIVLSGRLSSEHNHSILRMGAHEFLCKSWLSPSLVAWALENARERFASARALHEARARLVASEAAARKQVAAIEAIDATAPVGLCLSDTSLRYAHVNATLAAMHGVAVEAHLGRSPRDVLSPALAELVEGWWRWALETGEPLTGIEIRAAMPSKPALLRDLMVSVTPLRDERGALQGVTTVVQDLSALKDAERERRRQDERLRMAVNVARMAWWEWDLDAGQFRWSEGIEELCGRTLEALRSDPSALLDVVHPEDRAHILETSTAAVEQGAPLQAELRLVRPDGSACWVECRAQLERDAAGTPRHVNGMVIDVTAKREAAAHREALLAAEAAARGELERIGRMKDEFLATLSHELRTPLNAIIGWSDLLGRGALDEASVSKAIAVIARNAQAQAHLIDELLDTSRVMSGKLRLVPRSISLAAVATAALDTIRPAATAKGILLESSLDDDVTVYGDPDRLQQALWNLLSNAVKFTERGGTVSVELARREADIALSVRDSGQGIAAEFLPHVFERFRQADASAARRYGGLGLGLALVHSIAELHGGTAHVASEGIGRGSTFTLLLPMSEAAARATHSSDAPEQAAPSLGEALRAEVDLSGTRVLVVDDQQDARMLVERLLAERGAAVTLAGSAEEALGLLESAAVDVVVADIGMPELDGYEMMRRLRSREARVPAVALTAFTRQVDRAHAFEAGYQAHVAKPVNPSALLSAVAQLARPQMKH